MEVPCVFSVAFLRERPAVPQTAGDPSCLPPVSLIDALRAIDTCCRRCSNDKTALLVSTTSADPSHMRHRHFRSQRHDGLRQRMAPGRDSAREAIPPIARSPAHSRVRLTTPHRLDPAPAGHLPRVRAAALRRPSAATANLPQASGERSSGQACTPGRLEVNGQTQERSACTASPVSIGTIKPQGRSCTSSRSFFPAMPFWQAGSAEQERFGREVGRLGRTSDAPTPGPQRHSRALARGATPSRRKLFPRAAVAS